MTSRAAVWSCARQRHIRDDAVKEMGCIMDLPVIYICYGMPKAGSTLAFNVTRAIALRCGFEQSSALDLPSAGEHPNFLPKTPEVDFSALLERLQSENRRMVILKTHRGANGQIRQAVRAGLVRVQAICRDPRDIALSMRDAGAREDAWGGTAQGEPVRVPEDVRGRLRNQARQFQSWRAVPGCLLLSYEEVAFNTARMAREIARHMDLPPAPVRDSWAAKRRFSQFNRGVSQRHRTEMTAEQSAEWYAEFGDFIDAHCPPARGLKIASRTATLAAQVFRRSRGQGV